VGGKSGTCVTLATPEKYTNAQMFFLRSYLQFTGGVTSLSKISVVQMAK